MSWFSPLKGAYPGLDQIDKTLLVGEEEFGIVRGSLLYVDGSERTRPVFRLAGDDQAADPAAYLYFALVGQEDFQAGMAGTVGQGGPGGGLARITGLACGMPIEFQTDQINNSESVYSVGTLLTVTTGGKLRPVARSQNGSITQNIVAQVTEAPFERWVNDAYAIGGRRTGAVVKVLAARTMWVPRSIVVA